MEREEKIYVAGHRGLVGSALVECLENEGFSNLIYRPSSQLDLRNQAMTEELFRTEKPDHVFLSAAKVGGILANRDYPADFIYDNLSIAANVIHSSHKHGVKKLLFLGSSCIYPKFAPQPIKEDYLLTGELEPTNEPYAVAKIAGIKMCQAYNRQYGTNFICAMPTNLYGPNDNFSLNDSHVIPALIMKFYRAVKEKSPFVEIWGTGKARREFLFVHDLAEALVFLMENYSSSEIINVGTGEDITISELADAIRNISGYRGDIRFDRSKPDGTPRKLLDISRISEMGWRPKTSLEEGLKITFEWYCKNAGGI
jgi:GDP-L-fucose synthase